MLNLELHLDIVDPETGNIFDPNTVRSAWFRRSTPGFPSLADTIGELMARTGLSVVLVDNQGNNHEVIAKTVGYATRTTVSRHHEVPFTELAIMSDTDEIIELG